MAEACLLILRTERSSPRFALIKALVLDSRTEDRELHDSKGGWPNRIKLLGKIQIGSRKFERGATEKA